MASCEQWYYAEDGDGNSLPFTMRFEFYEWVGDGWAAAGLYGVGPGSFLKMVLDSTKTYKTVPLDEAIIDGSLQRLEGWTIPLASAFSGCAKDITFVYEKICDPPKIEAVACDDYTPKVGQTVSFWRDGEYGGDGQYIVARKWDFGDGGSATTQSATHTYTVAGDYVVRLTVTNDCGKTASKTLSLTAESVVGNGFTIQVPNTLAGKTITVGHVVKMPFIGLVGPDPDLWYWPQAFDYVGGKWYMADPDTKYRVEVGSIFETIPPFNKTYGTGSFADGIHCVVLAEGDSGVNTLVFKGADVFQLFKDSPTEVYLATTSNDTISEAIMGPVCDLFGIARGAACNSFWAEFYDPVYVANYISILQTGKDTLGNDRELSAFDHIALPFAVLGSLPGLSLLPFGALVTKGLGAISKAGVKFGDAAVQFMLNFSMDASNFVSSKDTWHFLDAIGQVTEAHATEIVNALTAGDTTLANTLLRQYAGESKGWWDYHALNDMLRDALPTDAYNWLRTQIGLTEIGAGTVTNTAKQATLSADDIAKLADAASDSGVMDEVVDAVSDSIIRGADPAGDWATNVANNLPDIGRRVADEFQSRLDEFDEAMRTNDDAYRKFHELFETFAHRVDMGSYTNDEALAMMTSFRNLFEAAPSYFRKMFYEGDVFTEVPHPYDDIYSAFQKAIGTTATNDMLRNIFKFLPEFVEGWMSKIDNYTYGAADITKIDIKEFIEEVKMGPEGPYEILLRIEDDPSIGITPFSDFMQKLIDDGGSKVILRNFFIKYASDFDFIKNAQGEAAAHAWAISLADETLRPLNTDILVRNFYDGTTAIVKQDIDDAVGMSADQFKLFLQSWKTSDDLPALITKLDDGTDKHVLGNVMDSVDEYYATLDSAKGTTVADNWIDVNLGLADEALDAADPAKMSDIPHATQEYAASYADVATDMGGNIADDIIKATDDLVAQSTSNWQTAAKQTVKNTSNKFWNYFNSLSDAGQERVVHGMIAGALVFAAVVLYKIYTNAEPQSLNHGLFTSKMESMYWPCFHACEDNRANDLDAAIKLYESVINECVESLYEYKTVLESDGTYEEFSITLQIHQFNLSRMKSCLEQLQPCGNIHCTSNEDFFYVDLDGQPAGFSYANREILLTAVKTGSHTVKIHKHGYIPESCSKSINVTEGDTKEFDCYMTEVGVCSPVTDVKIYIDPLFPVEDQTVSFNGSASSDDPITNWEWDFGDSFTATGKAVTHPYDSKGIYTIELKVTNNCEETTTTTRNVTVSEEEPPVESTTLIIERMINKDGVDIPRYWEVEVWVDGKYTKCRGPQTLTFGTNEFCDCESPYNLVPCELGTHTITLKKDGYDDLSISVYLEKDTPKTWESPVMEIAKGVLTLRSNQTGFDGYVDGVHVGNSDIATRLVVFDVELGVHTIKISKGVGYMPEYCETSMVIVRRSEFTCDMQPVTTRNIDLVLPEGATLWVDGQLIETTVVSRLSTIFRNLRQK